MHPPAPRWRPTPASSRAVFPHAVSRAAAARALRRRRLLPARIALRVEEVGVAKAGLPALTLALLGVAAGAYVGARGAAATPSWLPTRRSALPRSGCWAAIAFSLGLVLVAVAGAELFTGNNLPRHGLGRCAACARGSLLLRNWAIVCGGQRGRCAAPWSVLVWAWGTAAWTAAAWAARRNASPAKLELPWTQAFLRGVLCNVLRVHGGVDGAGRRAAWSTRWWRWCSRSRASWPPASSTRSPTCTPSPGRAARRASAATPTWP
jgi:hypothetical protein